MSESWDDYADEWDLNPDVIRYAENAYKTLIRNIDITGLNILDFGCGTGLLTEKMATTAEQVIALDNSARMIDILTAKNIRNVNTLTIDLATADLKSYPSLMQKFDLITASSVFSFVEDYAATISKLKTLLAPNGRLIQWDWYSDGDGSGFTPDTIENAYQQAGYNPMKIEKAFELNSEHGSMSVIMAIASPQF